MPQNDPVVVVDPKSRKILITYKKVDKLAVQGNFNLSKTGHNYLEITEDTTLEIKGVTSLEIDNLGDEEVVINGYTLLPLPHFDSLQNKYIDGSTNYWDLIDRAMKRNSKIFVLPDGTYSDVTLNINFLGQDWSDAMCNKPHLPFPYPNEVTFNETVSTNPLSAIPFVSPDYNGWVNYFLPYIVLVPIGTFVKVIYKSYRSVDLVSPVFIDIKESINPCVLGQNDNINIATMPIIVPITPGSEMLLNASITFQRLDTLEFSEEFFLNFIK